MRQTLLYLLIALLASSYTGKQQQKESEEETGEQQQVEQEVNTEQEVSYDQQQVEFPAFDFEQAVDENLTVVDMFLLLPDEAFNGAYPLQLRQMMVDDPNETHVIEQGGKTYCGKAWLGTQYIEINCEASFAEQELYYHKLAENHLVTHVLTKSDKTRFTAYWYNGKELVKDDQFYAFVNEDLGHDVHDFFDLDKVPQDAANHHKEYFEYARGFLSKYVVLSDQGVLTIFINYDNEYEYNNHELLKPHQYFLKYELVNMRWKKSRIKYSYDSFYSDLKNVSQGKKTALLDIFLQLPKSAFSDAKPYSIREQLVEDCNERYVEHFKLRCDDSNPLKVEINTDANFPRWALYFWHMPNGKQLATVVDRLKGIENTHFKAYWYENGTFEEDKDLYAYVNEKINSFKAYDFYRVDIVYDQNAKELKMDADLYYLTLADDGTIVIIPYNDPPEISDEMANAAYQPIFNYKNGKWKMDQKKGWWSEIINSESYILD